MLLFQYHKAICERFPAVVGGIVHVTGTDNRATPDGLLADYLAEQQAVRTRIGDTPLSELAPLAAWRSAFRRFGVNPTQYRSAPEALLRRLTKKDDIPSINLLVDLCNLVSIRYAIPIAAVNMMHLQGTLSVHFAEGNEPFKPLGVDEVEFPDPGEVIFTDETKRVFARRWCWRQSYESAAMPDTTEALITIEALHETGRQDVEAALSDVTALLAMYTESTISSAILDPANPQFEG